jgi:hypothetical protein
MDPDRKAKAARILGYVCVVVGSLQRRVDRIIS